MVYSPDQGRAPAGPGAGRARTALLAAGGRRHVLSGSRVLLGRSRECDVVVYDPNVSRRHTELNADGDRVEHCVDLGSTNGMKVNRRRVGHARLRHGRSGYDRVTDLTFELD